MMPSYGLVCPLFEPFLQWLYSQNLTDLDKLPDVVELPHAPFAQYGYRRSGGDYSGALSVVGNMWKAS